MTHSTEAQKDTTPFLQTHSSVRPYDASDLEQIFLDMASEMKSAIVPANFRIAATSIGTHAPKLNSARNPTRAIMALSAHPGNGYPQLAASGNGALAQYMKVLLRPIAIFGQEGEPSLFQRAFSGAANDPLLQSFAAVFGDEALEELLAGIQDRRQPPRPTAHYENMPIFFVPGQDGGDLQVTPAGYIAAHANMKTLSIRMRSAGKIAREKKDPDATYGEWRDLSFSNKPQNLIVGAPTTRTRFVSRFPTILSLFETDLWRWTNGGSFPRFRDFEVARALVLYARELQRLEDVKAYRGGEVLPALDRRADYLLRSADSFVSEIFADPSVSQEAERPNLRDVLSSLPIRSAVSEITDLPETLTERVVRQCLVDAHFCGRLKKFAGVQ